MGIQKAEKDGKEIIIFYGEDNFIEDDWVRVFNRPLRQLNENAPQIQIILPQEKTYE